jgi:hypothetical protein
MNDYTSYTESTLYIKYKKVFYVCVLTIDISVKEIYTNGTKIGNMMQMLIIYIYSYEKVVHCKKKLFSTKIKRASLPSLQKMRGRERFN